MGDYRKNFYDKFPLYTNGQLQCVNGVMTNNISTDAEHISNGSPCTRYHMLFSRLKPGMTIDECFEVWNEVLKETHFQEWLMFHVNKPQMEYRVKGYIYKFNSNGTYAGKVIAPASSKLPIINITKIANAMEKLKIGQSWESCRDIILSAIPYARNSVRAYNFSPHTKRPTKVLDESLQDRKNSLPPLLSTHKFGTQVIYDGEYGVGHPREICIELYTTTHVWSDPARTVINPAVKQHMREYFAFATKCAKECDYLLKHPSRVELLVPRRLRVTRDCCIVVDFDFKKAV